ncbi:MULTISPECIES: Uma2 family endonuclease [unclassified Spirulina]|uniref:Uma2 family endonuclease n=1 Tax=unclassified Spirulina TaxID=2684457 RepID=UPI00194ED0F8|nr:MULTISPECIES: Uma2 family endonuclease [Spirulina]MEA5467805.1 Uma2 family endonuclease [Spirulina sp. 06S082]
MVQTLIKKISIEEFLKLPETRPASEYINGQILQKPMPQGKHSKIQAKLVTTINQFVEESEIAQAFPELRCVFGGRAIVPDVTVFAWDKIPVDENDEIANIFNDIPDLIVEVLSPDQSQTKVTGKILHALNYGSQMGWLIDPSAHSILIYPPQQQPQLLDEEEQILPVPELIQDLKLTVGDVFGWLKKSKKK